MGTLLVLEGRGAPLAAGWASGGSGRFILGGRFGPTAAHPVSTEAELSHGPHKAL